MITLGQLRTRCKQLADMENSYFIKDEEWDFMINQSYGNLYDLVVTTWENYFVNSLEFTLSGNTADYTIPEDFYKLRGIDIKLNDVGSRWWPVTRFNFTERHKYGNIVDNLSFDTRPLVQYIIMGNLIKFEPAASAAGTYKMYYIPKVTQLVDDSDEVDQSCDIWNEYIINDVVAKAKTKEESDARPYIALRIGTEELIQKAAINRDTANTGRVADVNAGLDDWWGPGFRRR